MRFHLWWRRCIDRQGGRNDPNPRQRSGNADGVRASEFQHAVEDMDSDAYLGRLTMGFPTCRQALDEGLRRPVCPEMEYVLPTRRA